MKLKVGATYEWGLSNQPKLTYLCVEECLATTVRFKKKVPGYKLLILAVDYPAWFSSRLYNAGDTVTVPEGAHITVGVKRLD